MEQGDPVEQSTQVMSEAPPEPQSTTPKRGTEAAADQKDPTPTRGTEEADVDMLDSDAEPELLQVDSAGLGLFPNAPGITVAKRCKGDKDSSPMYLNRYGPRQYGWFVWSTEAQGTVDVDKLQDVADKYARVLDYPRRRSAARVGASDVSGIINMVWDCPGLEDDPLKAAELLNPNEVKNAGKLSTTKSRQEWLKQPGNKLQRYPPTYVEVKYSQDMKSHLPGHEASLTTRWELGSQYKALYRRSGQIETEMKVYKSALSQAHRFLNWYKTQSPENFKDGVYVGSKSREPTLQPFDDKSPTQSVERDADRDTPSPPNNSSLPRGTQTLTTAAQAQRSDSPTNTGTQVTPPAGQAKTSAAAAAKPKREMVENAARKAYNMNIGKTEETLDDEDKLTRDMYVGLQLQRYGFT